MSNMKLKEFIKAIRNCKTAEDERSVVSKESALIRNAFKVCILFLFEETLCNSKHYLLIRI